jgi:ComEC/Rec2-related protein
VSSPTRSGTQKKVLDSRFRGNDKRDCYVAMLLVMTIKGITDKISGSPSLSALFWIGAFVSGIAAATVIFPTSAFRPLRPLAAACLASAALAGMIKNKGIRLLTAAGLLFSGGFAHYLSSPTANMDLDALFPILASAKAWLMGAVSSLLPEPEAGFLSGLLVGGGMSSSELKAAFAATGTVHVMALSGWNVGIISRWLDNALIWLRCGKRARWAIVAASLAAFVVMTGAPSSLVRAAVMSFFVAVALASGRKAASARALLYAGAGMLLFSPRLIAEDLGFLLSVAATAGIIYLSPLFRPLASRLPPFLGLPQTAADTFGATVATLPVTLAAFGQASSVSLPANLFLLPFIPPTIGVGFLSAVAAEIFPSLAGIGRYATATLIAYDTGAVKLFSRIPGAAVTGAYVNGVLASAMFVSIVCAVIYAHRHPFHKKN